MYAIEIKNVNKSFGDFAIRNLNLILPSGCILGLVGENGAGKSTTIKMIMNALSPDSGTISILGTDNQSDAFTKLKNEIGVVLDESYFPDVLNPQNVNAVMKNIYQNWDEKLYFSYLQTFNLPKEKIFKEFSRGMKMKLSIAVALSHHPKLLVLDEATSGLDPFVRDEILDVFNEFTRDETHSVLISSHIVSDLEKICDYIAFLHNGSLLFCEEKDRLLEEYAILRLPRDTFASIPASAIKGKKQTDYDVTALVKKNALPSGIPTEKTTIEEIILFLAKGDK